MLAASKVLVAVTCAIIYIGKCHSQKPSMFGADDSFRLIVQRSDTIRPFSGDFGKGGSSQTADASSPPVANLNKTFAGRAVPLEVLKVDQTHLTPDQMCEYLKTHNPDVTVCVADFRVWIDGPAAVPNDPDLPQQWALNDVKVGSVWSANQFGHKDIKVCMVDTGSDLTHPDLKANLWMNPGEVNAPGATAENGYINGKDDDGNGIVDDIYGVNFVNGANGGNPQDDNGHGSFVAGVVGAVGNNGIGISGLNQVISIISCKFMDAQGNGWASDAVRCFDYCIKMGAHVISNSWGGVENSNALQAAVKHIADRGILMVASAGNEGVDTDSTDHFPSTLPDDIIIAVAAGNRSDGIWYKSNYGKTTVDISAPGVQVLGLAPGGQYQTMTGTSMATPHVAGAAALLLAQYADNGYDISVDGNNVGKGLDVKKLLMSSADNMPGISGVKLVSGHLNIAAALALVPTKKAASEGFGGSAAVEGEKDDSSPSVTWRSGVGDLLPQNDVRPTGGLNVIGGGSGTLGGLITWPNTRQNLMMGASMGVRSAVQAVNTNVVVPAATNGTYPFPENTNGTAPQYMNGPGGQVSTGAAGPPSYPVAGLPVLPGGMPAGNGSTGSRPPQLPGLPALVQPAQLPSSSSAATQASNRGPQAAAGQFPAAGTQQPVSSTPASTPPSPIPGAQASSVPQAVPMQPSSAASRTVATGAGGTPYAPERGQAAGTQPQEVVQGRVPATPGVSAGAPLVPGSEPLPSNGTEPAGGTTGAAGQTGSSGEARDQPGATAGPGNQGVPATAGGSGGSARPADSPGTPGAVQTGPGAANATSATLPGAAGAGAPGGAAAAGVGTGIGPGQPGGVPGDPGVPGGNPGGASNPSATGPGAGVTGGAPIIPLPADPGSITGPLSSLFGSTVAGSAVGVVGEQRGPQADAKVAQVLAQIRERTPVVQAPPDMAAAMMGSFPMEHDGARLVPGPPPPPGPPPSYINPRPGDVSGSRISVGQTMERPSEVLTEGTQDIDPAASVAPSGASIEASQDAPGPTAAGNHAGAVPGIFEIALPYHPEEAGAQSMPAQGNPPAAQQQPPPAQDVVLSAEQMKDLQELEAAFSQNQPTVTPPTTTTLPVQLDVLLAAQPPANNPPPVESVVHPSADPVPDASLPTTRPTQSPNPPAEDSAAESLVSQPSTFSVSETSPSKDPVDQKQDPPRQADLPTSLLTDTEHVQEPEATPVRQAAGPATVSPNIALKADTSAKEPRQAEDAAILNDPLPSAESFPSMFLFDDPEDGPEDGPQVDGQFPVPPLLKGLASMLRMPRPTSFQESQPATSHPRRSHTPAVSKRPSTSKAPAAKQKLRPTSRAASTPTVPAALAGSGSTRQSSTSGSTRQSTRFPGTSNTVGAGKTRAAAPGPGPADRFMRTPERQFAVAPAAVPARSPGAALEVPGLEASSIGAVAPALPPGNLQTPLISYPSPHVSASSQLPDSQTVQRPNSFAGAPAGTVGSSVEATLPVPGPALSPTHQSQEMPAFELPTSLAAQTSVNPYFASFPTSVSSAPYIPSLTRTASTLSGQSDPVDAAMYGQQWGMLESLPSDLGSEPRPVSPGPVTDTANEAALHVPAATASVTLDSTSHLDNLRVLAPLSAYDLGLDDEVPDIEQIV